MQAPSVIQFERHVTRLSERETDEVVEAVADLIVSFLKGKRGAEPSAEQERTRGRRDAQQPESR